MNFQKKNCKKSTVNEQTVKYFCIELNSKLLLQKLQQDS